MEAKCLSEVGPSVMLKLGLKKGFPTFRSGTYDRLGSCLQAFCLLSPFFLSGLVLSCLSLLHLFSLSPWAPVALQCVQRLGFVVVLLRRVLFLESILGTLCTDSPYECADGLIKP